MKNAVNLLLVVVVVLSMQSCKKCKGEDPRARIVNNGTESVSVHIETSGGNTVNINNIDPGTNSEYSSFAVGSVEYTVSIGNSSDVVLAVDMTECMEYDIQVDSDNIVTSIPTDRNE